MALLSEDLIAQARNITLLEYMQRHEPSSIKKGAAGRYVHKDHDSFVIDNGKGQFFWNSQNVGGHSAVDYLVKVEGMSFRSAVLALTGGEDISSPRPTPSRAKSTAPTSAAAHQPANSVAAALEKHEQQEAAKPFRLPKANPNRIRILHYLQGRGIDSSTILKCVNQGLLYESEKGSCIFVGRDKADGNKAKYAAERSTYGSGKKDIAGSDKQFGFCIPPDKPSTFLAVFESPIDSMAHKDLLGIAGTEWDGHRLSLAGVTSKALDKFLEQNPEITHIWLCLDKDKAGHEATKRIIGELLQDPRRKDIKITVSIPPMGKDWGDSLVAVRQLQRDYSHDQQKLTSQSQSRPKQDAFSL